ncbi:MAG TPA: hypothetical protein VMJ49_09445 [Gaiellaceae bacterium]|nr:hypothetical protein [Gaiellaceae bacterium]
MGIVNTRNAVIGWAVVKGGKYAVRKKAEESRPSALKAGWAAGTLAAAALVAWRVKSKRRAAAAAEAE